MTKITRLLKNATPLSIKHFFWDYLGDQKKRAKSSIIQFSSGKVVSGHFKGMIYIERSVGSAYLPKLLGTYEKEVFPVLHEIIHLSPRNVINIGAAEGYYAVGLLIRMPNLNAITFETHHDGRALQAKLAEVNGVSSRISIRETADHSELQKAIDDCETNPLLIVDIEGGEKKLLDPDLIPGLAHSFMLVELHDGILPGITEALTTRFSKTHTIEIIKARKRSRSDLPEGVSLSGWIAKALMDEERPFAMSWMWMKPRL